MYARKAMSPLIATVLLIAFAVALGAMIMNWSSDNVIPKDPNQPTTIDPCTKVTIEIGEAFGAPLFCHADGMIKFNVVNTGQAEISGLELRTISPAPEFVNEDIPDSAIAIGGTFFGELPTSIEGKIHADIVPYVMHDGKKQYCVKRTLTQDTLPACSE